MNPQSPHLCGFMLYSSWFLVVVYIAARGDQQQDDTLDK